MADRATKPLKFHDSGGDAISTFSDSHRARWESQKTKFTSFHVFPIPLDQFFEAFGFDYDFLNLDVEGTNLGLFNSVPFESLKRLKLVCVEHDGHYDEMESGAARYGFRRIGFNGENLIAMLSLPHVTLLCADCLNGERAVVALERSKLGVEFGGVKLLTSEKIAAQFQGYPHLETVPPINSINDYSAFCIKEIHKYCPTTHFLLVQHDGCVLNPEAWEHAWNNYDYIGPLFEQELPVTAESVGTGGFSYRSKRLAALCSQLTPAWDGSNSYNGYDGKNNWGHEDGVICKYLRRALTSQNLVFGTPEVAAKFAFGRASPNAQCEIKSRHAADSFGFHGFCPEIESRGVQLEKTLLSAARIKRHYEDGNSGPLSREQVHTFLTTW